MIRIAVQDNGDVHLYQEGKRVPLPPRGQALVVTPRTSYATRLERNVPQDAPKGGDPVR